MDLVTKMRTSFTDSMLDQIKELNSTYFNLEDKSLTRRVNIVGCDENGKEIHKIDVMEKYFRDCRYDVIGRAMEILNVYNPEIVKFYLEYN
jgi:hypothetical protein